MISGLAVAPPFCHSREPLRQKADIFLRYHVRSCGLTQAFRTKAMEVRDLPQLPVSGSPKIHSPAHPDFAFTAGAKSQYLLLMVRLIRGRMPVTLEISPVPARQ